MVQDMVVFKELSIWLLAFALSAIVGINVALFSKYIFGFGDLVAGGMYGYVTCEMMHWLHANEGLKKMLMKFRKENV